MTAQTDFFGMASGAEFSPDRRYRYVLTRQWSAGKLVVFIGFNPSTADENVDDPTIRRVARVPFASRRPIGEPLIL